MLLNEARMRRTSSPLGLQSHKRCERPTKCRLGRGEFVMFCSSAERSRPPDVDQVTRLYGSQRRRPIEIQGEIALEKPHINSRPRWGRGPCLFTGLSDRPFEGSVVRFHCYILAKAAANFASAGRRKLCTPFREWPRPLGCTLAQ